MRPENAWVVTTALATVLLVILYATDSDPMAAIGAMFGAGVMLVLCQRPGQGGPR